MKFESFDPLSSDHQAAPYAVYDDLAARGPLHRTRSGLWLVSGHALAGEVLRNRAFRTDYSRALERTYGADFHAHAALRFLSECFVLDTGKAGGEIRKHFARHISPARAQAQSAEMRRLADTLFTQALAHRPVDLLRDFAVPFTLQVVCLMLDVPKDLAAEIPDVSSGLLKALDCARLDTAELQELDRAVSRVRDKVVAFLDTPRARESECIDGLLRIAREHGLSHESLFTDLLFIFLAGFETTSTMAAQVPGFLAARRDIEALALRDPAAIPGIVEEYARLHPPVHIVTRRPAEEITLGDTRFTRTSTLLVLIGAANRDPAVFDEPGEFRLGRPRAPIYTFSAGAHSCIGAPLARHELAIAFETLAGRRELAGGYSPTWRRMGVFRSLSAMHHDSEERTPT